MKKRMTMARRTRIAVMAIAMPAMAPAESVKVLDEALIEGLPVVLLELGGWMGIISALAAASQVHCETEKMCRS
jgi:hypothetical protein